MTLRPQGTRPTERPPHPRLIARRQRRTEEDAAIIAPAGLTINDRDLQVLQALAVAPWSTVQGIEWLFWPSWRERWQKWHDAYTTAEADGVLEEERPVYHPTAACYVRLKKLEQAGYLYRVVRTVAVAVGTFRRVEDLLALAPRGGRLLQLRCQIDPKTLYIYTATERSIYTLEHTMDISRIYAALCGRIAEVPGLALEDWRGDHITATDAGRVPVPGTKRWLQPDGAFFLRTAKRRVLFFVENDRERSIDSWIDKIHRYVKVLGSEGLARAYDGEKTFGLLAVTTTDEQRRQLQQATAKALAGSDLGRVVAGQFFFGLQRDVHPRTIGTCWTNVMGQDHMLIKSETASA